MNRLEQARAAVRQYPLPEKVGARFTPDEVADSLQYVIHFDVEDVDDESAVRLGASKYRGLPHLPAGFDWPAGHLFAAQFNLADLHPLDVHGAFPQRGLLSVFFNEATGSVTVLHFDGSMDALRVTPYPDPATIPHAEYYLDPFRSDSATIAFQPAAIFYLGSDAYDMSEGTSLIPPDLRAAVERVLGCPIATEDSDTRIFGRPMYWQDEDIDWEPADEFDDDDPGDDPDDDDPRPDRARRSGPKHLLFQDAFGDGNIMVFVSAADAARRDYSDCWIEYSGT